VNADAVISATSTGHDTAVRIDYQCVDAQRLARRHEPARSPKADVDRRRMNDDRARRRPYPAVEIDHRGLCRKLQVAEDGFEQT
jgi:hypothetical protein